MGKERRIKPGAMTVGAGRDELNLAEFPLCVLAHRSPKGQKTLQFEDRVWDASRQDHVVRLLTVTGADAFGLPTALDDEVLLGLVQLSRQLGFVDRKVPFTRYQLIRLLGWRDEAKSYCRLTESLNRWMGVTLAYQNAWWDKVRKCWMDEKFHVLDNVRLSRGRHPRGTAEVGGSFFIWNEVLFRSFQAGNLKGLDFEFYKSLRSAVAKRLYRFLDKRFFWKRDWEFDLRDMSWNHIGLSRNYDTASLKRKLVPAIAELESAGYLETVPAANRFSKVCSGVWLVRFQRRKKPSTAVASLGTEAGPLAMELVGRGVAIRRAEEIVQMFPEERIRSQLEAFDWLRHQKDRRVSRNPPGFLLAAIEGDYTPPSGFLSRAERIDREAQRRNAARKERIRRVRTDEQELVESERRQARVERYLRSVPDSDRARLEADAIEAASRVERSLIERGGSLADAAKRVALESFILALIEDTADNSG